jgi:acetolactate synthase-1/2/3 large subunit
MNVSDYVVQYLADKGIKHVFLISGGGCMHLIDAVGKCDRIKYVCNHHEQACAMAAEGYARLSEGVGACIVTTGPGGTNSLTGVMGCWTDSIPTIFISGQVATNHMMSKNRFPVRQIGDQEVDIIRMVSPITKYAKTVADPETIKFHLDTAYHAATTGRPGPVWLDIPLDVQRAEIFPEELFGKDFQDIVLKPNVKHVQMLTRKIASSKKPVFILGNGVRLAGAAIDARQYLNDSGIPTVTGVNGNDLMNHDDENYCGRFGILGQPAANHIIQNSDLIISVGCRLTIKQTGYDHEDFARNAFKIYVDIDKGELVKSNLHPDMAICSDAKEFFNALINYKIEPGDISEWQSECKAMVDAQRIVQAKHKNNKEYVSNYVLVDALSATNRDKLPIITSDGSANVVTMHAMRLKGDQRMFTNTGCASMGYGLPAAIGACFANDEKPVICLEGDGSIQMNIQELQTVVHHKLPIKIIVMNNQGYLSIKMTQESYLGGRLVATGPSSGVSFPSLEKIAEAYGLKYFKISTNDQLKGTLRAALSAKGPVLCEVMSDPQEIHEPKIVGKVQPDGSIVPGKLDDIEI